MDPYFGIVIVTPSLNNPEHSMGFCKCQAGFNATPAAEHDFLSPMFLASSKSEPHALILLIRLFLVRGPYNNTVPV